MIDLLWEETIEALGVCRNCLCSDCGCCIGCGGINADFEDWHGYGCVM